MTSNPIEEFHGTLDDRIEEFRGTLDDRSDELASLMPTDMDCDAFVNTAIVAVKSNPDLLAADRSSLHIAVNHAARDGLRPDGKEGVILVRNTRVKRNGRDKFIQQATWQPMLFGIRKRAREIEDIIIDAEVVYENDDFQWCKGDDQKIVHIPTNLGNDPGELIGCYAIFRKGDDILHREVMRRAQVEAVKSISKHQAGLLWNKFEEEAWKKSVVRRGSKTVPFCSQLRDVIERFDEAVDLTPEANDVATKQPISIPFDQFSAVPTKEDSKPASDAPSDPGALLEQLRDDINVTDGDTELVAEVAERYADAIEQLPEHERGQAQELLEAAA